MIEDTAVANAAPVEVVTGAPGEAATVHLELRRGDLRPPSDRLHGDASPEDDPGLVQQLAHLLGHQGTERVHVPAHLGGDEERPGDPGNDDGIQGPVVPLGRHALPSVQVDGDEDQDGSDTFTFKEDFGRSTYQGPSTSNNPGTGDFDCDGDVDGTDTTKFLEDLGRFLYNKPCPQDCQVGDWCVYE